MTPIETVELAALTVLNREKDKTIETATVMNLMIRFDGNLIS